MAATTIRLNVDASQAKSQVDSMSESLEGMTEKLKEATEAGNWHDAANLSMAMNNLQQAQKQQLMQSNNASPYTVQARKIFDEQQAQANKMFLNNSIQGERQQDRQRLLEIQRLTIKIESLTDCLDDLNDKYEDAAKANDARNMVALSTTRQNTEEEKSSLESKLKQLLKEDKSGLGRYFGMKELQQAIGYTTQFAQIGSNYRMDIANGNYLSAGINRGKAIGDTAGGLAMSVGTSMMLVPGLQIPGAIVAGTGGVLKGVTDIVAGYKEADNAEASAYEKTLSSSNALNKLFSGGGDWKENARLTTELLKSGTSSAENTGLSTNDFLSVAAQQARYGAQTPEAVLRQVRLAGMAYQATGTDISTLANFIGLTSRYGDTSNTLDTISKARNATGMTRGQNTEFLSAVQKVIEDGIANGYIKSTEDVAKNLTMFAHLTDNNPLYQGEQGANRLLRMNSGLAGTTAMQSTSDMLVMSAAKSVMDGYATLEEKDKLLGGKGRATGTYLDYQMLAEQGVNPEMFVNIGDSVKQAYGDDVASRVETYKKIYGVNTSGAKDIDAMYEAYSAGNMKISDFINAISTAKTDSQYYSEETKKTNYLNSIETNVALIGQSRFWEQFEKLAELQKEYEKKAKENKEENARKSGVLGYSSSSLIPEYKTFEQVQGNGIFNRNNYRAPAGYGGTTYNTLFSNKAGNEDFDNLIKSETMKYALNTGDKNLGTDELSKLLSKLDKEEPQKAYNSGDREIFLSELTKCLKEIFGSITIQE